MQAICRAPAVNRLNRSFTYNRLAVFAAGSRQIVGKPISYRRALQWPVDPHIARRIMSCIRTRFLRFGTGIAIDDCHRTNYTLP